MIRQSLSTAVAALAAMTALTLGCGEPTRPPEGDIGAPAFSVTAEPLEATGDGGIGSSVALPGSNRQEFDFFVTTPPGGRFFFRDYGVLRTSPGLVATMTVDPADPATAITQFEQTSALCVTIWGIGRVDTGDLFSFMATGCDNGTPGAAWDYFKFSVSEIGYSKAALLTDGEITITGETMGDLQVTTVTTGNDLDSDGYTVTVGAASQAIGTNTTVEFNGVLEGTYLVDLSGLAANCAVSGSNPQTVTITAGAVSSASFDVTCTAASTGQTVATGQGVIGTGPALPEADRFELDFEVNSDLTGRLLFTDWSVTRSDGSAATMTVDAAADPATFISSFSRTSATCVAFGGVGRLNDGGSLHRFFVDACDNANPGAGADTFSVDLPDRPYSKSGTLNEGDIAISTTTS